MAAGCSVPHISEHFSKCLDVELLPEHLRVVSLFLERFEEWLNKAGGPLFVIRYKRTSRYSSNWNQDYTSRIFVFIFSISSIRFLGYGADEKHIPEFS